MIITGLGTKTLSIASAGLAAMLMVACSASPSTNDGSPRTALASAMDTPTIAPIASANARPTSFESERYGYRLTVPAGWTGGQAFRTWDGTGAPGYDSLPTDKFGGPTPVTVWAYARPFDGSLSDWVSSTLQASSIEHTCPTRPESNERLTVGDERARLLGMHCPSDGGIFVAIAVTVHDGSGFVFAAQDSSGGTEQPEIRFTLLKLVDSVSF